MKIHLKKFFKEKSHRNRSMAERVLGNEGNRVASSPCPDCAVMLGEKPSDDNQMQNGRYLLEAHPGDSEFVPRPSFDESRVSSERDSKSELDFMVKWDRERLKRRTGMLPFGERNRDYLD